jgi:glycosyltransferase involved in cell wall biosynthesis
MIGHKDDALPVVLIYIDSVPPPRMPFVLTQSEALKSFNPYFVGVRRIRDGFRTIPTGRTFTINSRSGFVGRIREFPFRRFGFAPIFQQRLRKLGPLLMHAHSGYAGVNALGLAECLRIPLVTTFHGRDATIDIRRRESSYGQRRYARQRLGLAQKGNLFIAVSRFMKDKMVELGFPEERTTVHYTGVDVDFFAPDPAVRRDPIALFVGRLDEMKGCEFAISAMARIQSKLPEVEFLVIGDGPLRHRLEQLAEEKLRSYRFLGIQSPQVVRHWMNRAQIFVVPSVTARTGETETFGMVFAEAQAMQLPVITFASGGIPEAVAHGETGLLSRERDWEALANDLETLLQSEPMRLRMGDAGRRRVCSLFNLRKQTTVLEDIYRQMTPPAVSAANQQPLYQEA